MFESFKARKVEMLVADFESWQKKEPELQELATAVSSKMNWETEDVNGEQTAVSFTPEDGYYEALERLRDYLDRSKRRYTDLAIAIALAKILDVDDRGYAEAI